MKKIIRTITIAAALLLVSFAGLHPQSVNATTNVPLSVDSTLSYLWNFSGETKGGWAAGLGNPQVTIGYNFSVYDHSTGAPISPGGTVAADAQVDLKFLPYASGDISWFGTGYSSDSPYGTWSAYQNGTPVQDTPAFSCAPDDFVQNIVLGPRDSIDVYVPLVVNKPARSLSIPAGLSACSALTQNADGSLMETCTVTGTGTITPVFQYTATSGYFYYRYYEHQPDYHLVGCYGNNTPMVLRPGDPYTPFGQYETASSYPAYVLQVPAQNYDYPLVVPSEKNQPPQPPTLSCPTNLLVGHEGSFILTGSDPQNATIRYGIDWAESGSINEWAPSSGYVPSGTSQTVTHSWNTPGTYTVKALVQNSGNVSSDWTPCTVTISDNPAPQALLTATPGDISSEGSSVLEWTCLNSTKASIDQSVGAVSPTEHGTVSVSPKKDTAYTLQCVNDKGETATDSASVLVGGTPSCETTGDCCANNPSDPSCIDFCSNNPTDPACVDFCTNHPNDPSCGDFCANNPNTPACVDFCAQHPNDINCTSGSNGVRALLNAEPASIVRGLSSTLTWSSEGATSCAGAPALLFNTHQKTEGHMEVSPLISTLFTLECKNDAGDKATDAQNVEVTEPVLSISATPALVRKGETSVIKWSVLGDVDSCAVVGPGISSKALSGTVPQIIGAESTYVLSCDAGSLHQSKSATVKVAPNFKEI